MLVVRLDKDRTIIVHDGRITADTCSAYSYAQKQHDASRIVIVADVWNYVQLDALYAILFETRHWVRFLDYVASVLYPHAGLQEGYSDA